MPTPAEYAQNLRNAYSDFAAQEPPHGKAALDALIEQAHTEALEVLAGRRSGVQHPHLLVAWAMLHPEVQNLETRLALRLGPKLVHVDHQGAIWGAGKYQQLDPGWSEALVQFIKYRDNKATFGSSPQIIDIPNNTTFTLIGDWGTGFWQPNTGAERVQKHIAANLPDYTIHLGDVYYSGNGDEEEMYLINSWPKGRRGSFTLNSNHEMYSGGHPYFERALAPGGPFDLQKGTSYFALKNDNWLVVGLDTAYYSSPDQLYNEGAIDPAQGGFLGRLSATIGNRRVIIISHHEGFDLKGEQPTPLRSHVVGALGREPDYWYWGHAHNVVVYKKRGNSLCRCVGHGAIPYGRAADLAGAAAVEWFEDKPAGDQNLAERVLNGYARIELNGASLTEQMIAEDTTVRWQNLAVVP